MIKAEKKYAVNLERIDRFLIINEAIREMTANAEVEFYGRFQDLSLIQASVIRIINHHNPCSMGQITKSTGLTLGSITQIIDKLIQKGYVKRKRSPEDRRVVFAELTAKGKRVIAISRKYVAESAKKMLSKYPEPEQDKFLEFFQKMAE